MKPKSLIIFNLFILQVMKVAMENRLGRYQMFTNKSLGRKFYQGDVDTGLETSVLKCSMHCFSRTNCQAFYLDTTCHLIINPYRIHSDLLLSNGTTDLYLAQDDLNEKSCNVANIWIAVPRTPDNFELLYYLSFDKCIALCQEHASNNNFFSSSC